MSLCWSCPGSGRGDVEGAILPGVGCMISPLKGSGSHFQLLAKLTSLLRNPDFRKKILAKRSGAEVFTSH